MAQLKKADFVIGIDIGTSYSGFSYASIDGIQSCPPKYYSSIWSGSRVLSLKAPTSVLFDKEKQFIAFGYEAGNRYSDALAEEEQDSFYYFQNLKLKDFTRKTMILDISGKPMEAILVVTSVLECLKNIALKRLEERERGRLRGDYVCFVLTTPVSWDEYMTEFMIAAMEQTGTKRETIFTVHEPAAAFACFAYSCDKTMPIGRPGHKVLVVDAGGEATKLTVLEARPDEELYQIATGEIPLGGQSVNRAFIHILSIMFNRSVLDDLKQLEFEDYIDLLREFEIRKRSIRSDQTKKVVITLPISLTELVKEKYGKVETAIQNSRYNNSLRFSKQKLHINPECFRDLFREANVEIVDFVKKALAHPQLSDVRSVLLVGGHGECELLQDQIRKTFRNSINLIISEEPGLSVMRGAVLCGHKLIKVTRNKTPLILSAEEKHGHEKAQISIEKCVSCDNHGIVFCHECKSVYCEKCKSTHERIPATKLHKVIDLKRVDRSATKMDVSCSIHKQDYAYACTDCEVLICSKCVITTHKGHTLSDIKTVVDDKRQTAANQVAVLKTGLKELESEVSKIKQIISNTTTHHTVNEMRKLKKKLDEVVQRHITFRYNEIDDAQQLQQEDMKYDLNRKERILEQQWAVAHSLERLLSEDYDVAFFTTYKVLKKELIDVNDVLGSPITREIKELDKRLFIETTVNAMLASFDMSPVAITDGKVVLQENKPYKKGKP